MQTSALNRPARLVLHRLTPPWRKVVQVRRITVAGFMAVGHELVRKSAEARVRLGREIADTDVVAALGEAELCGFADLVCEGQPPGFFTHWLGRRYTQRNLLALLEASRRAEGDGGWTRILSILQLDPKEAAKKKTPGGGLPDLILTVCRSYPGADPLRVMEWPMQFFLDQLEALLDGYQRSQATSPLQLDDELEPDPLSEFEGMGGRLVH